MKKVLLTVVLSLITSLTIYFVGFWEPNEDTNKNIVQQKDNITKESKNSENVDKKQKEINNTYKSEDNKLSEKETQKEKENYESDNIKNNNETLENEISKEEKESVETNVQIFNINKEDILSSLNLQEKTKLLNIAKKLSVVDGEKIKNSMQEKSELEGIKEVFEIIKLRLTDEDYNEVKKVLSPYINIEFLEELV